MHGAVSHRVLDTSGFMMVVVVWQSVSQSLVGCDYG